MEQKNKTKKSKNIGIWIAIGVLAIIVVASIFTGGFQFNKNGKTIQDTKPDSIDPGINMNSLIDDDAMKGDPNAPVTIVEFSDYECPFCAKFYSQTFSLIQKEYIDTGKVNFVYRDFPLGFHKQAQKAAEAAECAGKQGKYYDMHDLLFEKGVSGGIDSFKQYAQEIGLNAAEFNECLDSGEMAKEIKNDMNDGQRVGVRGTPAFFINGKMVSGAQPFSVFQEVIEGELN